MRELLRASLFLGLLALLAAGPAHAAVVGKLVPYVSTNKPMEGYLAYDDAVGGPRPAVLVVHDWRGVGPFVKTIAERLAAMGYVAMAADIYGQGVFAADNDAARALATPFYSDRGLLRTRARDALYVLLAQKEVDALKVVAIGYCFGGTTVLEMARANMPLSGVVSFHGGLATPAPAREGEVRMPVLVLHGADDPHTTQADVTAFMNEMRAAKADWQLVQFGGAVHSFTNPEARDRAAGNAFDPVAEARSWQYLTLFLKEVLAK